MTMCPVHLDIISEVRCPSSGCYRRWTRAEIEASIANTEDQGPAPVWKHNLERIIQMSPLRFVECQHMRVINSVQVGRCLNQSSSARCSKRKPKPNSALSLFPDSVSGDKTNNEVRF